MPSQDVLKEAKWDMLFHIISYHIISYHIISYHIISYHIISYHISYHIIYHIISYHYINISLAISSVLYGIQTELAAKLIYNIYNDLTRSKYLLL